MTHRLIEVETSLKNHGFTQIPSAHIPQQELAFHLEDVKKALLTMMPSCKKLVCFVDGTPKNCLTPSGQVVDLDDYFFSFFKDFYSPLVFISLNKLLNVSEVHASQHFLEIIQNRILQENPDGICVMGSGSVTDLIKHSLYKLGPSTPLVSLPTALTVTAFTSSFAVLDIGGAKRTFPSLMPTGVIWCPFVLSEAPVCFTRAGYGDLLARFLAYGDWKLGWWLGAFSDFQKDAYSLMEPFSNGLLDIAESIGTLEKKTLTGKQWETLVGALSMAGITMNISEQTTPLSGFEHVISHGLDYLRLISHRPLVLHGEQVALGCSFSAVCWEWLLNQKELPPLDMALLKRIQTNWSPVKNLVKNAPYFGDEEKSLDPHVRQEKMNLLNENIDVAYEQFQKEYKDKQETLPVIASKWEKLCWEEVHGDLKTYILPLKDMVSICQKASLPLSPEDSQPSTTSLELRWAIRFAPFVRKRFSLADFLFWAGEDPAHIAGC